MEMEPNMPIIDEADNDEKNKQLVVDRLRSIIERIEHLEEEKNCIAKDIREIYCEAKSAGFDAKAIRSIIRLRKMDAADRDNEEYLVETYKNALGM